MKKEEWLVCSTPKNMLAFLDECNLFTEKDWRLLACSFARTALPYTTDPVVLATIEVAERFAVGEATREELNAACSAAWSAAWSAADSAADSAANLAARSAAWSAASSAACSADWSAAWGAAYSAACSAAYCAANSADWSAVSSAARSAAYSAAQKEQCDLIRSKIDPFPKETVNDSNTRKNEPVYSGFDAYFPRAKRAVSRLAKKGNDKHNPGQPLHWSKGKSADHPDCAGRHQLTPYEIDPDSDEMHLVHAWMRVGMWLEIVLEAIELGLVTRKQLESGEVQAGQLGKMVVASRGERITK